MFYLDEPIYFEMVLEEECRYLQAGRPTVDVSDVVRSAQQYQSLLALATLTCFFQAAFQKILPRERRTPPTMLQ